MDNVLAFEPRQESHAQKQFEILEEDLDTRLSVSQWIARLAGLSDVKLSRPTNILLSRRHEVNSVVIAVPTGRNKFNLVVSQNFISWLSENAELEPEISNEVAKHYVSAFGAMYGRLQNADARSNGSYLGSYWSDRFQQAPLHRLPYRMAGLVALSACNLEALELEYQQYEPHIAGLANPLEPYEFKAHYNCFTISRDEQGELGCD